MEPALAKGNILSPVIMFFRLLNSSEFSRSLRIGNPGTSEVYELCMSSIAIS